LHHCLLKERIPVVWSILETLNVTEAEKVNNLSLHAVFDHHESLVDFVLPFCSFHFEFNGLSTMGNRCQNLIVETDRINRDDVHDLRLSRLTRNGMVLEGM